MAVALSLLFIVVLLAVGVPFWVCLGLGTVAMLAGTGVLPLTLVGEALFEGVDSFALIAIPLFILTGDVMVRSGLAHRLLGFAEASLGWLRSGFGTSTAMGCGLFACISGSDAADAAAIGRITMDKLVEKGYPKPYACALVASGACTGILIPPSIAYIIIGLVLGISSATLFQAAFVPGVIVLVAVIVTNAIVNRVRGYERSTAGFSAAGWVRSLNDAKWALAIPVIILGGIYSGVFTPTEAAAVAVAYCLLVELFLTRGVKFAEVSSLLVRSGRIAGIIGPVIAFSVMFAEVLAVLHIPERIAASMMSMTSGYVFVLLMVVFVLLVVGCFLETIAALIIIVPILMPVAHDLGVNPVHFGVLIVCALTVGFLTPPVGINLFAASAISGVPYLRIALRSWPLLVALTVAVVAIAFVPWLSIWFM